ncbi:predicted protein [Naegleria gruberi]|uniref:Predicted protein n=1 Tax=Naegleria gruberi TaxID=5762 RepID=D2V1Q9_NAEGR|nr:uncharacterized protein NAEGRDRAFT_62662 [Naegleria gruberi]EFC49353.1 predicted protein [Naegleria gruberi]|eukprot:XP_002682097.1 predicted protein [Naegleria gruberi strain NEG-M]
MSGLRKKFNEELSEFRTAYDMLDHIDSVHAPEGYLVFFDEVDRLCEKDNSIKPLETLFNTVAPLVVGKRSSVIVSGHSPIQYQLQTDRSPSDYQMVFLPSMDDEKLKLILECTVVNLGGKHTSLSHVLSLLGLKDEPKFITLLKEYAGTVPRIMRNSICYILSNQTRLETTEKIEAVLNNRAWQKSTDVTIQIGGTSCIGV